MTGDREGGQTGGGGGGNDCYYLSLEFEKVEIFSDQ